MRRAALILRKDLLVLRRSPLLLGVLVAYPITIALLVGLVAAYATSKPRVAFVDEDGLPRVVEVGGQRFDVDRTIHRVSKDVTLVRLPHDEAERQLRNGKVVAVITVPPGFVATLKLMVRSPELRLETTRGGLSSRVTQQVQALVYSLNHQLQHAYINTNLRYVRLILHGGRGDFGGQHFDMLGLEKTQKTLAALPGPQAAKLQGFVQDARSALRNTDDALRATANPIALKNTPDQGRTWALSAQVQAYALALTITFLALMLTAGAVAAERDENVIGRLARGLVTFGEVVWAKVALAATLAVALGLAIALAFGGIIQLGGVEGGEPWSRLPVLVAALVLAGGALGSLGALLGVLAREARTASLVAILVVLPIVFLGLVPQEVVPPAAWASDAFPFVHAVRLFSTTLFDIHPWGHAGREALWLLGLGGVFGALTRLGMRRLLT